MRREVYNSISFRATDFLHNINLQLSSIRSSLPLPSSFSHPIKFPRFPEMTLATLVERVNESVARSFLGRHFRLEGSGHPLERSGSKFLTEIRAGAVTFAAMAYIVSILNMDRNGNASKGMRLRGMLLGWSREKIFEIF